MIRIDEVGGKSTTVIPWFTRLLWQPKNRVNRNSCYTSHSIDKIIFKNVKKISIKLFYLSLYKFFWTRTKNRVIENRVMENRVKRGITVM